MLFLRDERKEEDLLLLFEVYIEDLKEIMYFVIDT